MLHRRRKWNKPLQKASRPGSIQENPQTTAPRPQVETLQNQRHRIQAGCKSLFQESFWSSGGHWEDEWKESLFESLFQAASFSWPDWNWIPTIEVYSIHFNICSFRVMFICRWSHFVSFNSEKSTKPSWIARLKRRTKERPQVLDLLDNQHSTFTLFMTFYQFCVLFYSPQVPLSLSLFLSQ